MSNRVPNNRQAETDEVLPWADVVNTYRDAVAKRAYWEDHGTRRDGHLEDARAAESKARRALVRLIKSGAE